MKSSSLISSVIVRPLEPIHMKEMLEKSNCTPVHMTS